MSYQDLYDKIPQFRVPYEESDTSQNWETEEYYEEIPEEESAHMESCYRDFQEDFALLLAAPEMLPEMGW